MRGDDLKDALISKAMPFAIPQNLNGVTMVIAPHPDDESLGCGGTIALLKNAGEEVYIIFISDGSMSHPNSKKYPAEQLVQLREEEALAAAKTLGVPEANCIFLKLKDAFVPAMYTVDFSFAVNIMSDVITTLKPANIILPWKNDPHPDHRASWQIVDAAVKQAGSKAQLLHYLIWFWERGEEDAELEHSATWHKVDIKPVIDLKQLAIAAHVSQVTHLIDDDENGFMLSGKVLNHFSDDVEVLIKLKNW